MFALRRLTKDWEELQKDPLPTASASPIRKNGVLDLFSWDGNITAPDGPYAGVPFHISIRFPSDYPSSPPSISLRHRLSHPNVFGSYICLDLLNSDVTAPYTGWSSAYTVSSILMQLQAFLFDANVPQSHEVSRANTCTDPTKVPETIEEARKFKCGSCQHRGDLPWPPFVKPTQGNVVLVPRAALRAADKTIEEMPDEILLMVLDRVDIKDLWNLSRSCRLFKRIFCQYCVIERRQLLCFHSKVSFEDDLLGYGVTPHYYQDGQISNIEFEPDLLSLSAFASDSVRASVWKLPFTHFVPLILSPHNAAKALPHIKASLLSLYAPATMASHVTTPLARSSVSRDLLPSDILSLVPRLMNSTVLRMVQTVTTTTTTTTTTTACSNLHRNVPMNLLHASESALLGYCAFHHMLLHLSANLPAAQNQANQIVDAFVADPTARTKAAVPDLGLFLCLLTLTAKSWPQVAKPFITECLERNARYVVRDCPHLADPRMWRRTDWSPEEAFFEASKTSRHLVMFQVAFLRLIGRPPNARNLLDVLSPYNQRYGHPTSSQLQLLQSHCRQILTSVTTWSDYLSALGLPPLTPPQLRSFLFDCVRSSITKGYFVPAHHRLPQSEWDEVSNLLKKEALAARSTPLVTSSASAWRARK